MSYLFLFLFFLMSTFLKAQNTEKLPANYFFSSTLTATNNGISVFPNLSLGKPAGMFDVVVGRNKLSYEPQLRFSLEGEPWSFIFWVRYKLYKSKKFLFNVGAHPALLFTKSVQTLLDGTEKTSYNAQRYLAAEFVPVWLVSKNFSLSMYYLTSTGVEKNTLNHAHFLMLNPSITINLYKDFYARIMPQIFYLKMDEKEGFYGTGNLIIGKKNSFALAFLGTQKFQSTIPGKDFVWNLSLSYTINKFFEMQRNN